MLLLGAQMV